MNYNGELSEEELLLLSNLMYCDDSVKYESIRELLNHYKIENGKVNTELLKNVSLSGGVTVEDYTEILIRLNNQSEDFKNLRITRTLNDSGIRGACFVSDGNPYLGTIVFMGTGGKYNAWADNLHGEYTSDTPLQKRAADFVKYECGEYDNICLAGHSKGGNLACYSAVINNARVRSCVSYDGQGFSKYFYEKYNDEINRVKDRCVVYAAHNDYVNILLSNFAKTHYLDNTSIGPMAHSSVKLLTDNEFDANGNFKSFRLQDISMLELGVGLGLMTGGMNLLPKDGNRKVTDVLGSIAASLLSSDNTSEYEMEQIKDKLESCGKYFMTLFGFNLSGYDNGVSIVTPYCYVDVRGLYEAVNIFDNVKRKLEECRERIIEYRHNLCFKAASELMLHMSLMHIEERIEKRIKSIESINEVLLFAIDAYSEGENKVLGIIA